VILHTRFATQGLACFPENNHPVNNGSVWVVHNGHVSNDAALFDKLGKARTAVVDSEALAAVLARNWNDPRAALERVDGAFAFAAVNLRYPGELLVCRGSSSPLYLYEGRNVVVFASTASAVRYAWKDAISGSALTDKQIVSMREGQLLRLNGRTRELSTFTVPQWKSSYVNWHDVKDDEYGTGIGRKLSTALAKKFGKVDSGKVDTGWTANLQMEECIACFDYFPLDELSPCDGKLVCDPCLDLVREYGLGGLALEGCNASIVSGQWDETDNNGQSSDGAIVPLSNDA
jgi:hypothetical protein